MILADQFLPLTATVTPPDQAAVAGVIRKACETSTPIYPLGGGTLLGYGAQPARPGVGLSLLALGRVIDYPARDLTITVEAGVSVGEIARRLAAEGQRLPVDVPEADCATIGGVVAAAPAGPRRFRWGTMRDYVIGLTAVDGRGETFSAGGRVVKNAAGYDLCRLLTGALGTLGVITQVTLMVKPAPETSAFVLCAVPDWPAAERLLADLARRPTTPSAIELLCGPDWNDVAPPAAGPRACTLAVGFEGTAAEVRGLAGELETRWRVAGVAAPASVVGDAAAALWLRLSGDGGKQTPGGNGQPATWVEIRVLPSALVRAIETLRAADPGVSIQAHAGDGILRAALTLEPAAAVALLDERFRGAPGSACAVVRRAPESARLSPAAVWGPATPARHVMEAIRTRFDPQGILNPGRYVF